MLGEQPGEYEMSLKASEGEQKPKQLPPAGTHAARCIQVIDLGVQATPFGDVPKLRITWELPDEKAVFDEKKGEQPFVVSKEYTRSLYEKSNLYKDLVSWRGKEFTEDELRGFDVDKLLGAPCLLSVVHKTTEKNKTFANVSSISKLPKGMACAPQINESVKYQVEDGRNDVFKSLPTWLQEKIAACQEWSDDPHTEEGLKPGDDDDSSIPF